MEQRKKSKKKKKKIPKNLMLSSSSSISSPSVQKEENLYPEDSWDLYPTNDYESRVASADFHLHSTHSDGLLNPTKLVELVSRRGLKLASLTDHDTIAGVAEAVAAGIRLGVRVIPGVEISASAADASDVIHILGYFPTALIKPQLSSESVYPSELHSLEVTLQALRRGRLSRARGIVEKLEALGIQIQLEEVLRIAGEAAVGRPHIARALLQNGHVKSIKEAFNKFLHNGGPAFVQGTILEPKDAVRMIREAGGIAVLAHPWCLRRPLQLIESLTDSKHLAEDQKLQGIEAYKDAEKAEMFTAVAKEFGLLPVGGSDFHGIEAGGLEALAGGRQPGDIPVPEAAVRDFVGFCASSCWRRKLRAFAGAPDDTATVPHAEFDAKQQQQVEELRLLWPQLSTQEREVVLAEAQGLLVAHVVEHEAEAAGAPESLSQRVATLRPLVEEWQRLQQKEQAASRKRDRMQAQKKGRNSKKVKVKSKRSKTHRKLSAKHLKSIESLQEFVTSATAPAASN